MGKKRKYIPNAKFNPVVQAKKIEDYKKSLQQIEQTITLITESNEKHYQLLGNFARHDIKNIIINLNSIIELFKNDIPEEVIHSIQLNVESLSTTTTNFSKLIPHSDSISFKFNELLLAVRLLTKPITDAANVECTIDYDNNQEREITLPFQALLQMINNLTVNAIKAVENNEGTKRIHIRAEVKNHQLLLSIEDNGCKIPSENIDKLFDFRFTTTNGSGIGLNHAKYLCEKFNGKISLDLKREDEMQKSFEITIPIL